MMEETLWHKLKNWLIKKLGGVTEEERKDFYAHRKVLSEELEAKEKEIRSLKQKLQFQSSHPNEKRETIYVEKHLVEPVLLCQTYAVRDFHCEFDQEKVEKILAEQMIQKIADFIVSHKLYEMRWCDDQKTFERLMEVRVRVVPPIKKGGE